MGRRTKLTPEIEQRIIQAIQAGGTYQIAAQFAGIGESTLYLWMKQGREGRNKAKVEFLENIKRAESRGAVANLSLIQRAAQAGDWKASAWILERRHGYSRNKPINNEAEEEADTPSIEINTDTKSILKTQLEQSIKAGQEALSSGSYQAFAALQRQTVNIALQLKIIEAESAGDAFDSESDTAIIDEISAIISSLPPVLRQRLQADIIGGMGIKSSTVSEA